MRAKGRSEQAEASPFLGSEKTRTTAMSFCLCRRSAGLTSHSWTNIKHAREMTRKRSAAAESGHGGRFSPGHGMSGPSRLHLACRGTRAEFKCSGAYVLRREPRAPPCSLGRSLVSPEVRQGTGRRGTALSQQHQSQEPNGGSSPRVHRRPDRGGGARRRTPCSSAMEKAAAPARTDEP